MDCEWSFFLSGLTEWEFCRRWKRNGVAPQQAKRSRFHKQRWWLPSASVSERTHGKQSRDSKLKKVSWAHYFISATSELVSIHQLDALLCQCKWRIWWSPCSPRKALEPPMIPQKSGTNQAFNSLINCCTNSIEFHLHLSIQLFNQ